MTSSSNHNKTFVDSKGDTEETSEVKQTIEQLHKTIQQLEAQCPDYGVGK